MTDKLSGCTIKCTFSFTEGREKDGFNAYELMRHWAHMEATYDDSKKSIWLENEDLLSTEPWIELKPVKLTIPGRDEPYVSDKEAEEQYRLSDPPKISQTGFARYLLRQFGVIYETCSTPD